MSKILITGATGGLGRSAVKVMSTRADIRATSTGRNVESVKWLQAQGVEFFPLDLAHASQDELRTLVRGCHAVWHCAALSSPWGPLADFEQSNVIASRNLAQAAYLEGVDRFVHVSTPALYFDFTNRYDVTEEFKPSRYVNHYAATKAQAEKEVLAVAAKGLHVTLLRPRAIFGEYDQVLIPRIFRLVDKNKGKLVLPHGGQTVLDLTYADNVVHAMRLATTRPDLVSGETFNITNGQPMEVRQVLGELFSRLRKDVQLKSLPYPVLDAVARTMETMSAFTGKEPALTRYSLGALAFDMTLDISKAQALLGYVPPISMTAGIKRLADHVMEEQRKAAGKV